MRRLTYEYNFKFCVATYLKYAFRFLPSHLNYVLFINQLPFKPEDPINHSIIKKKSNQLKQRILKWNLRNYLQNSETTAV